MAMTGPGLNFDDRPSATPAGSTVERHLGGPAGAGGDRDSSSPPHLLELSAYGHGASVGIAVYLNHSSVVRRDRLTMSCLDGRWAAAIGRHRVILGTPRPGWWSRSRLPRMCARFPRRLSQSPNLCPLIENGSRRLLLSLPLLPSQFPGGRCPCLGVPASRGNSLSTQGPYCIWRKTPAQCVLR
jgi:hypothetical protein